MKINLKNLLVAIFFINSSTYSLHLAVNYKSSVNLAQKQAALDLTIKELEIASDDDIVTIITAFRETEQIAELRDYANSKSPKTYHKVYDAFLRMNTAGFIALIEKTKQVIKDGNKEEAEIGHKKIISILNPNRLQRNIGQKLYEIYLLYFCFDTDPKIQAYCKSGLAALQTK